MNIVLFYQNKRSTKLTECDFCCLVPSAQAETTPARSQRMESLGGLVSPQLAVCAPSGAALPLPSSTTSPVPSKPAAFQQRASSSIKQWLSPTQGSSGSLPHEAVIPCLLNSQSSASAAEQRAKRRLGADDCSPARCGDSAQSSRNTEICPAAKRSRVVSDVLCSIQESSGCRTEDSEQAAARRDGKENCNPTNWLSEMSQKMRNSQEGPSISRSPVLLKKHDVRTHTSTVSTDRFTFYSTFSLFSPESSERSCFCPCM